MTDPHNVKPADERTLAEKTVAKKALASESRAAEVNTSIQRVGEHDTKVDLRRSDASRAQWQRRYDSSQTGWDRGAANPALFRWLSTELVPPCSVLVPGCGRGHEVIELAARGFAVTAVDFARAPIRELTYRLSSANLVADVVCENVLRTLPNKPFDAVYEQTCLCAMHPKLWAGYEMCLARNLSAGGKLFALFLQTSGQNGPPFHCSVDSMKRLFDPSRWIWPNDSFKVDHPSGMHEIAFVLTKREKE